MRGAKPAAYEAIRQRRWIWSPIAVALPKLREGGMRHLVPEALPPEQLLTTEVVSHNPGGFVWDGSSIAKSLNSAHSPICTIV